MVPSSRAPIPGSVREPLQGGDRIVSFWVTLLAVTVLSWRYLFYSSIIRFVGKTSTTK